MRETELRWGEGYTLIVKVIIYEKLHEKSATQNHMDYDHNFVLNASQEGNMKK